MSEADTPTSPSGSRASGSVESMNQFEDVGDPSTMSAGGGEQTGEGGALLPPDEAETRSALQVLDERFADGSISGKQLAHLKETFTKMVDAVARSRQSEYNLMDDAKTLTHKLTATEAQLAAFSNPPADDSSEIGQQRQLVLKHRNTAARCECRIQTLNTQIESLNSKIDSLRREYDRMPDPEEVNARTSALDRENQDLQNQLKERSAKVQRLQEDLQKARSTVETAKKGTDRLLYSQVEIKDELMKARLEPAQLQRQITVFQREQQDLEEKAKALEEEHKAVLESGAKWSAKVDKLGKQQEQLQRLLQERQQHYEESQKEFGRIARVLEATKEEEVVLTGEKLQREMELQQIEESKQRIFEENLRLAKEKDMQLKTLKLRLLQTKNIEDALQQHCSAKKILEDRLKEVLQQTEARDRSLVAMQQNRRRVSQAAEHENILTETQKDSLKKIEHNEYVLQNRITTLKDQIRLANSKITQSEKDRDDNRRELEGRRAKIMELEHRMVLVLKEEKDLSKHAAKALQRLEDLRRLHDALKAERAKLARLVTLSERKKYEVSDKGKLHVGIRDVLKADAENKDRMLQQSRLQYSNDVSARDVLKLEVTQLRSSLREVLVRCDRQADHITGTTHALAKAKTEMKALGDRYKDALVYRDERGIYIISADEDLTVFLQKKNVQEKLVREASISMNEREEEIRFLKVELAEEQRSLEVLKANMPNETQLEEELVVSQTELSQVRADIAALEEELQSADCGRVRYLGGEVAEQTTLNEREKELQILVREKENQREEKMLMLEEVTRMTDAVQRRVDSSSQAALAEHNQLVLLRAKMEKAKRKTMAMVAELAVQQTEAEKSQQDVAVKEAGLAEARKRLDQGLPPNAEAVEEWRRQCRYDDQLRQQTSEETEPSEFRTLANGTLTTAANRSNAYMPKYPDDQLPLGTAKPFGARGAFAPQEAGAHLRHYRKPVEKPIEI